MKKGEKGSAGRRGVQRFPPKKDNNDKFIECLFDPEENEHNFDFQMRLAAQNYFNFLLLGGLDRREIYSPPRFN